MTTPLDAMASPPRSVQPKRRRLLRRAAALLLGLTATFGTVAGTADAHSGKSSAPGVSVLAGRYLVVGDTSAAEVYVYRVSDMRRTGQLDNVRIGSHMGTLLLPDGRLLLVDDAHAKVLALRIDEGGKPRIVSSAAITTKVPWRRAAWAAADSKLRYFAVASDYEDSSTQTVTVVK